MQIPLKGLGAVVANGMGFLERNIGLVICLLWASAIVVGLVQWATVTWSSQGRLVFTAISALSTLIVVGLVGWLPVRPARIVVSVLAVLMVAIAVAAPLLWIGPAYDVESAVVAGELKEINKEFADKMRLVGFSVEPKEVQPGDTAYVTVRWQTLSEMDRDWSVFVHLNDPAADIPVAQRDMYPGQGLVATRLLAQGDTLTDRYALHIPEAALAPADLTLALGLYDYKTGERLAAPDGSNAADLAQLSLLPRPGSVPNPLAINFENQLELIGFSLPERRLSPGEQLSLDLYWQAIGDMDTDYTLFAQVVDEDTTRWTSQDLALATSEWAPDEDRKVSMELTFDPATPAGVYPLIVGLYTRGEEGEFIRLQTMTSEGRLTDDYYALTQVRVE
jgi:hypothetical protein